MKGRKEFIERLKVMICGLFGHTPGVIGYNEVYISHCAICKKAITREDGGKWH